KPRDVSGNNTKNAGKMNQTIVSYYFSRNTLIVFAVFLIAILFLFSFLAIIFSKFIWITILFLSVLSMLLFILIPPFIKSIISFNANQPALILSNENLTDNINHRILKWSEIKKISNYKSSKSANFIAINVNNPKLVAQKVKNPMQRFKMTLNKLIYGFSFSIQPNIIKCNNTELLNTLNEFHTKYK
ncbi:STM3941 family protein, partial [Flavobacterium saliperosum]